MAIFGAPIALEDHAQRACRAALDIQNGRSRVSPTVSRGSRPCRTTAACGLNSGEVITGEIGSGPLTYTAIGEQVGMAQRMESVAPAGGVMVSESTARLVEDAATLAKRNLCTSEALICRPARRLLAMAAGVARRWRRASSAVSGKWAHLRTFGAGGQWQRMCYRCGGPAGYRQESHRTRNRIACRRCGG